MEHKESQSFHRDFYDSSEKRLFPTAETQRFYNFEYLADFTLRYARRATQDEIGRKKRILNNPVETPKLGVFTKMPPQ